MRRHRHGHEHRHGLFLPLCTFHSAIIFFHSAIITLKIVGTFDFDNSRRLLSDGQDCAQHMLMSAEPIRAVAVAAVDVIAIMSISLTAARFLSNRSQDRAVSVPNELTEERNIVGRDDELQAGMAVFTSG